MRTRDAPDEETSDWRAVCGRSASTVRRAGRRESSRPLSVNGQCVLDPRIKSGDDDEWAVRPAKSLSDPTLILMPMGRVPAIRPLPFVRRRPGQPSLRLPAMTVRTRFRSPGNRSRKKKGIIFSKSPHAQNVFIQGGSAEGRWRTNQVAAAISGTRRMPLYTPDASGIVPAGSS
jgi:hypothetical protein